MGYSIIFIISFIQLLVGTPIASNAFEERWTHYISGGSFIGGPPCFSPDNKKIIYTSPITGHGDIYEINLLSSKTIRLTNSNAYEGEANYSWDGKKICYIREEKRKGSRIYLMWLDSGNYVRISSGQSYYDSAPMFSHSGNKIVFLREIRPYLRDIFICNIDGSGLKRITNNQDNEAAPFWGPGDKEIYFFVGKDTNKIEIRKIDLTSLLEKKIAELPEGATNFHFSYDLKKIVFVSYVLKEKSYQLFDLNIKTRRIRQLTRFAGFKHSPSYSFDGSKIAFFYEPDNVNKGIIMIINSNGTKLEKVVEVLYRN